ncbi:response regulator transcription factor [bacterium]|nr:response regulator transcription factor [bacterium]
MIHISIVDDDPDLREHLASLLREQPDFRLRSVCGSAEEVLCQIDDQSHLLLVDLGLPGLSGQELIARVKDLHPDVACIAHTIFEDPSTVFAALRAGAAGYLVKGTTGPELVRHLRTLQEGGAPLTPRIARLLVNEFRLEGEGPLSDREREVLQSLAEGYSYKEVATQLVVSVHTVHTHVKHIYEKLNVRGRRQAVAKARQQGWLQA